MKVGLIFRDWLKILNKIKRVLLEQGARQVVNKSANELGWYIAYWIGGLMATGWRCRLISEKFLYERFLHQGWYFSNSALLRVFGRNLKKAAIDKPDIIFFPGINWEFLFQRPQQLASVFSNKGYRVFYLRINFRSIKETAVRMVGPGVLELQLPGPVDLVYFRDDMKIEDQGRILTALNKFKEIFGIDQAVLLVEHPFWATFVFNLKDKHHWPVLYDCLDDIDGFQNNLPKYLITEKEILKKSNWVMATSRALVERAKVYNSCCFLVPNGTDFEHFNRSRPIAFEIHNLRKPVIGYYGAISSWFDVHLISWLAEKRPAWTFLLIGEIFQVDVSDLKNHLNVVLLGKKPNSILPSFLQGFDVCIIPFKRTPLTDATNPVKLYEYLSAGKPVVSSRLTELEYYADWVDLVETPEEWLLHLDLALKTDGQEKKTNRIAFAMQNTWLNRVDQIIVSSDNFNTSNT